MSEAARADCEHKDVIVLARRIRRVRRLPSGCGTATVSMLRAEAAGHRTHRAAPPHQPARPMGKKTAPSAYTAVVPVARDPRRISGAR
jgi:hypothetical protein